MGKGERPEHTAPPDIFYNEEEARKYTTNRWGGDVLAAVGGRCVFARCGCARRRCVAGGFACEC